MKEYLGNDVSFVFDVKQAIRSGVDPFQVMECMGENLCHIHFSDHNEKEDCLPPGKGNLDLDMFLQYLKRFSYPGDIILELYRNNFGELTELIDSYSKLEKFFVRQNMTNFAKKG